MLSRTAESLKLVKAGLRTESRLNGSSPTYRRTHSPGHEQSVKILAESGRSDA